MENKTQMVELENDDLGPQSFEINHAERLLRMPNNGGWKLNEKSEYQFNQKDGIRYKQSTGKSKEQEKGGNSK